MQVVRLEIFTGDLLTYAILNVPVERAKWKTTKIQLPVLHMMPVFQVSIAWKHSQIQVLIVLMVVIFEVNSIQYWSIKSKHKVIYYKCNENELCYVHSSLLTQAKRLNPFFKIKSLLLSVLHNLWRFPWACSCCIATWAQPSSICIFKCCHVH